MERRFLWMLLLNTAAAMAQPVLPPACNPYPDSCLYSPGTARPVNETQASVTYRDIAGQTRVVEMYIRIPAAAQGALPVVVWSGGQPGSDAKAVMPSWSVATVQAGYLTVSVAHTPRTDAEMVRVCSAAEVPEGQCPLLNPVIWDGPQDLRRVLDWLEETNSNGPPEVRGRIAVDRIALAGHGEGANAAISLAGARRMITARTAREANDFTDPRPIAFVGLSPQGPLQSGFFDTDLGRPFTSWTPVERPVLGITSAGDNDCNATGACFLGDSPSRRRIAFDLMPPGNKYEMFVPSVDLSRAFLASLDTAACVADGIAPANCTNFERWLRASVLAFLDAHVRGAATARAWLQDDLIQPASGNAVEWRRK